MGKFITIVIVAIMATLTVNAGLVTSWSDDFTGADGTPVASTANWDATNVIWKLLATPWNDTDRTGDNNDEYIISNNQFYAYVGPCELYTNVDLRQQVQVSFVPKDSGDRIYLDLLTGMIELKIDLAAIWGNEGNRWGANQEYKVVLPAAPIIIDSHKITNYYQITFRMETASLSNLVIKAEYGGATYAAVTFASTNYVPSAFTPKSARLVVQAVAGDTVAKFYVDDELLGTVNGVLTADQMSRLYPYIWYGKFTGDGSVIADGAIFIDNYSVQWAVPEPSVFLLVLLAIPLLKRFRR